MPEKSDLDWTEKRPDIRSQSPNSLRNRHSPGQKGTPTGSPAFAVPFLFEYQSSPDVRSQGSIGHIHWTKITIIIILNNFFIYSLNFIYN